MNLIEYHNKETDTNSLRLKENQKTENNRHKVSKAQRKTKQKQLTIDSMNSSISAICEICVFFDLSII